MKNVEEDLPRYLTLSECKEALPRAGGALSRKRLMERIAERVLEPEERRYILKRVDIIGDIAIIKIHPYLLPKRFLIAAALLKELPFIRVVYRQIAPTEGPYRLKKLEWLAGEHRSWTYVKEFGCIFKVDVEHVFYTPRLSFEHMRIAKLVHDGEVVVNMFAGVGTFSIMIAKHANPLRVYSIDINPHAYELMKQNIELNKVEDRVVPILGDAANVITKGLIGVADRVLMPLPCLALKYLPFGLLALKPKGGFMHLYIDTYVPKGTSPCERVLNLCNKYLDKLPLPSRLKIVSCRKVRSVGPRRVQVVLDIAVCKASRS